jgi:beta-galactosidase
VIVQTRLQNYGPETELKLSQRVQTWKGARPAGKTEVQHLHLAQGEMKTVIQTLPITDAVLWSPENPFLYVLETSTDGDNVSTRFGMREFCFDNVARRALLNGKPYFLRGANITLHRFFGDPLSKQHPWEADWVRKLLGEIPQRMNWNSMRICIGPAPEMWLDIADEVGLLLQYEYAIWTGRYSWRHELWNTAELIDEFREYVQDNWNHPSVAIWDASNETLDDALREKVIPAVRGLDLSNRPWDNGYSVPQAPGDGYEDHPYIFSFAGKPPYYDMQALENMEGPPLLNAPASGHAAILNEYDSLFLKRDGSPAFFTRKFFDYLVGPHATTDQRYAVRAYLLAGLTEFWRSIRFYAGVMYLAYLDADLPHSVTCDNFLDPEKLVLQPHFEEYVKEAFKPLGVYIASWKSKLKSDQPERMQVMMVNDEYETARGHLTLAFATATAGSEVVRAGIEFEIPPLGQMTYVFRLQIPAKPDAYVLSATATWPNRPWSPVVSRRNVTVVSQL